MIFSYFVHSILQAILELYFRHLKELEECNHRKNKCCHDSNNQAKLKELDCRMRVWRSARTVQEHPMIYDIAKTAMRRNFTELYCLGLTDEIVERELSCVLGSCVAWTDDITSRGFPTAINSSSNTLLDGVVGLEETIWSPFLGLKGKIDILSRSVSSSLGSSQLSFSVANRIVPVELKTGKWSNNLLPSHRAQVILYLLILLLRDRGCVITTSCGDESRESVFGSTWPTSEVPSALSGLLLYLGADGSSARDTRVEVVAPVWAEVRSLIMSRNSLAYYMHLATDKFSFASYNGVSHSLVSKINVFPPVLRNTRDCSYCFQASECMTYHAALEGVGSGCTLSSHSATDASAVTEVSPEVSELYRYSLRHVTASYLCYIRRWENMLDMEEAAMIQRSGNRAFWMKTQLQQKQKLLSKLSNKVTNNSNKNTCQNGVQLVSDQIVLTECGYSVCGLKIGKCDPVTGVHSSVVSSRFHITLTQLTSRKAEARQLGVALGDRVMLSLEKISSSAIGDNSAYASATREQNDDIPNKVSPLVDYQQDLEDFGIGSTQVYSFSSGCTDNRKHTVSSAATEIGCSSLKQVKMAAERAVFKRAVEPHSALGTVHAIDRDVIVVELVEFPTRLIE